MPILFATDAATDVGQIAEANNFGLWTVSGNLTQFMDMIQYMSENEGVVNPWEKLDTNF